MPSSLSGVRGRVPDISMRTTFRLCDLANFYRRNRRHAEIAEKLGARVGLTIRVIGMEAGA